MRILRQLTRPAYVLVAVLVLLGGGLGSATALRPTSVALQPPAQESLPVSSATLVCPDVSALGDGSTDVTAGAASAQGAAGPAEAAGPLSGSVSLGVLDPDRAAAATADRRGPVAREQVTHSDAGPVVVRALGGVSPGVGAMQVSETPAGDARGLAAARCVAPGTDTWFVGLGTEVGHTSRLHLVNTEQAAASVELEFFGPDGRVGIGHLGDVVVGARSAVAYDLDALVPDEKTLAVHVVVRTGRVAAGILDQRVDGLTSLGADWVPASVGPANLVVVPGVSGGTGLRTLQVLAPGDLDTRVDLRLLTADGAITPAGLEQIELTAGEVAEVAIDPIAGGEPVSVELRSDQPIVAGLRVTTGASETANGEMAYTAASSALADPTFVPDARGGSGWTTRLMLAATEDDASVTITYVADDSGQALRTMVVAVPAGSTVIAPSLVGAPPTYGILLTPHGSGLMAVLELGLLKESVQYISLVPLASDPLVVDVPRVRQDLSTGLRSR